ncbi:hypothetical protein JCM17823_07040 [Halorubrum gandharaense]
MGGFKEGSVSGWDTEEEDDGEEPTDESNDDIPSSDAVNTNTSVESAEGASESETAASTTESSTESSPAGATAGTGSFETADIPWILRRSSITDGREQTVQLHLQESTLKLQREQKTEIEAQLGESVRKADLREAALLVGLQQTDDVIGVLREWGYALE